MTTTFWDLFPHNCYRIFNNPLVSKVIQFYIICSCNFIKYFISNVNQGIGGTIGFDSSISILLGVFQKVSSVVVYEKSCQVSCAWVDLLVKPLGIEWLTSVMFSGGSLDLTGVVCMGGWVGLTSLMCGGGRVVQHLLCLVLDGWY